jgi:hypothetical protein
MRAGAIALCLAALFGAATVEAQTPSITGLVLDDSTGNPVRGARVTVSPGRRTATTDDTGRFSVARLPAGQYLLEVGAMGYGSARSALRIGFQVVPVEVRLRTASIALDTVVVQATITKNARNYSGFDRRRAGHSGSGRFIDRAQLEARRGSTLPDIFRGIPGVRILRTADGSMYAASGSQQAQGSYNQASGQPCFAQVFVDGVRQSGTFGPLDLQSFSPSSLESVEYYRHPSSTPVEFRTGRPECGTLVLWTRRPVRRARELADTVRTRG